jgi:3-methyl-2-oxobutanoate hydroxymethyltransferase
MLVLEMVPAVLSGDITRALSTCATIGIGAGVDTAGQILVLHDMLGVTQGKVPKFAHNFMNEASTILEAMQAFVRVVEAGGFGHATDLMQIPRARVTQRIKTPENA